MTTQTMEATASVPEIVKIGKGEIEIHMMNRLRKSLDFISPQGNPEFLRLGMSIMTGPRSTNIYDRPEVMSWKLGRADGEELNASMYFNPTLNKAVGCIHRGHDMLVESLNLNSYHQFELSPAVREVCGKGAWYMLDWVDSFNNSSEFFKLGEIKTTVLICRQGIHSLMGALVYVIFEWQNDLSQPLEEYFFEDGTKAQIHFEHFLH